MKDNCVEKINTEDVFYNGCNIESLNSGDNLNKILEQIYSLLSTGNAEFLIIADRQLLRVNQTAVITGFNVPFYDWYVDDILQINNSSNTLIIDKACKVYAKFENKKSNTLYIDLNTETHSCNLLVSILNVQP